MNKSFFVGVSALALGLSACLQEPPINPPPPPPTACPANAAPVTPIPGIQGTGSASSLVGQVVRIEGVVIADFQGADRMNGFALEAPNPSSDPNASRGVFVDESGATSTAVNAGDLISITGTVREKAGQTLVDTIMNVTVCGQVTAPAPVTIRFPITSPTDLERYEGMLVTVPQSMTVTETFGLGRYGTLDLTSNGRVFNPTNGQGGSNAANALRELRMDDARFGQNPNPIPYLSSAGPDGTRRVGDTITNLTGVLVQRYDQGFATTTSSDAVQYRLEPTIPPTFTPTNPRPTPPTVAGSIHVSGANVLNFFTTLKRASADPACTNPVNNNSSLARGAESCLEFTRQRAKIVAMLKDLNADVFGLMELENNGSGATSAIQNLTDALNAAIGTETYKVVPDPTTGVGTDAIKVGLIYKFKSLDSVGVSTSDTNSVYSRPPVAQTFRTKDANPATFSVVVNHFKSKGSCPANGADQPNQDNGQGCWNALRISQAQALKGFLETIKTNSADPDVLVIGDLNAYGIEDPINLLTTTGDYTPTGTGSSTPVANPNPALVSLNLRIPLLERYSYVFDGQSGYLDHALATLSLDAQIQGITEWHINADEPIVLDYNTNFKTDDRYAPTFYRASDHDPVLVGLTPTPDVKP
jgi:uncharacterized protein